MFLALLLLNRHLGRSSAGIAVIILINFVYGFIASNVAWQAHLGGAITGAACAGILIVTAPPRRRRWQLPALALLLVLLVGLAVLEARSTGCAVLRGLIALRKSLIRMNHRITPLSFIPIVDNPCGQLSRAAETEAQRQRVVIMKPEIIRPKPITRFQ